MRRLHCLHRCPVLCSYAINQFNASGVITMSELGKQKRLGECTAKEALPFPITSKTQNKVCENKQDIHQC